MFPGSSAGVPFDWSGASGLPYYCTPPVTVADVIGELAVWQTPHFTRAVHLPLTNKSSSVGRSQAPHCWHLLGRTLSFTLSRVYGLRCLVDVGRDVGRDVCDIVNMRTEITQKVSTLNTQVRHHTHLVQTV